MAIHVSLPRQLLHSVLAVMRVKLLLALVDLTGIPGLIGTADGFA